MKRPYAILLTLLLLTLSSTAGAQQLFTATNGIASFYSSAPLEDISATSSKLSGYINTRTGKLNFTIPVSSFIFENTLMQEHFNAKFMESHRYPKASFSGRILSTTDFTKPGEHEIIARGLLQIHGVSNERIITATIITSPQGMQVKSKFSVKLEDHQIKVPSLLAGNIAEEVQVNISMGLEGETTGRSSQQALIKEE